MVSDSAYPKIVKFLWAGEKAKIWNFIGLFYLKKSNFGKTELETRRQFSPKLFMPLQCQNIKLLCQFLSQAIYFLAKTNLWSLKFWPFLPGSIKLAQFFLGWIGNRSQFFPKLFIALQCHNTKLLNQCTFNTKQSHKIWNFHLLACLGDFFSGLNWKPGVSTFYHSFWLNQFTFKRMPSDRPWKVWAKSELWFPIQPTQK